MDPDQHRFFLLRRFMVGRDGAIGIATLYRLDGPGIESRWECDFLQPCKFPWGPPSLMYIGCQVSFPQVNRPECGVEHPSHPI
jgi:hypothetical protein